MTLKVASPGFHTTVQDLGRVGWQDSGVPVSGALDPLSLRIANGLVGNAPDAAALEMLLMGPTLEVEAESVRVALAGDAAKLEILGESPRALLSHQSVFLSRGQKFRVAGLASSACAYLAIEGGIAVPPCLGSASTYVRGGLGGFEGRALRAGDLLPLVRDKSPERPELRLRRAPEIDRDVIRVVLGPQDDFFDEANIATFLGSDWRISRDADRMGMRLEGPTLAHKAGYDIVSDGIVTGAIQVPGSGQPILLLADHQTTGGYPKIATVISADLPAAGRRRPGGTIRFAAVTVEEAEEIRRAQERDLAKLLASAETVMQEAIIDLGALYSANLISGVVG